MTSAVLGAEAASARIAAQPLAADSTVKFDAVTVAYRGAIVLKPLTLDVAAGGKPGAGWPSGLRQDDGAKSRRRLRTAGFGAHSHRRRRCDRPAALRARPGDGRAELCAFSPYAGRRQRRLRPQGPRRGQSADRR